MIIYLLTFPSGKSYVGQTILAIEDRLQQHRRMAKSGTFAVNAAWRKYGEPRVTILERVETREELDRQERFWIQELDTRAPNGYNLTKGGLGGSPNEGRTFSEEVRQNMSRGQTGRRHSEETKAKMRAAKLGKPRPAATVEKIRKQWTPERRAQQAEIMRRNNAKRNTHGSR